MAKARHSAVLVTTARSIAGEVGILAHTVFNPAHTSGGIAMVASTG